MYLQLMKAAKVILAYRLAKYHYFTVQIGFLIM